MTPTPQQRNAARIVALLACMATENTGWRSIFRRWYYSDEALRNDATEMLHEFGFTELAELQMPPGTRLLQPVSRRGRT